MIYIAYSAGCVSGLISGMHAVQNYHNETVCDLLVEFNDNITMNENGECVLTNKGTYNQRLECYYATFIIEGEKAVDK